MKNKFINAVEILQIKYDRNTFKVGSVIEVELWVHEGEKKRIQKFTGLVIAKKNRGLNSSFTARKISNGEGVERVFQTHSPVISKITEISQYNTRKAKLYYFRNLSQKYIKRFKTINIKKII